MTRKIVDYGVLVQRSHGELVAEVRKLMAHEGWEPLGGVAVTTSMQLCQAVVKYDDSQMDQIAWRLEDWFQTWLNR
ncbi:hypothetical protein BD1_53 [Octadecabacter Antarctic BD virus 1]|nr:hypothetical protein BD1_53 [Octadecabacter Antarctic BD virus 1]